MSARCGLTTLESEVGEMRRKPGRSRLVFDKDTKTIQEIRTGDTIQLSDQPCPTCATLRRELEEAERDRDEALLDVEKWSLRNKRKDRRIEAFVHRTSASINCANAFLDAPIRLKAATGGLRLATPIMIMAINDYDYIKRLALKATGRKR
ncbi:MAG: hypothetical protein V3W37_02960 [Candidatus Binatia bacterium]